MEPAMALPIQSVHLGWLTVPEWMDKLMDNYWEALVVTSVNGL
jgi:hypothetical protein